MAPMEDVHKSVRATMETPQHATVCMAINLLLMAAHAQVREGIYLHYSSPIAIFKLLCKSMFSKLMSTPIICF